MQISKKTFFFIKNIYANIFKPYLSEVYSEHLFFFYNTFFTKSVEIYKKNLSKLHNDAYLKKKNNNNTQ